MYAVTSMPLVRRTRATLRSAEFGFFGVVVKTRTHTPRFCGDSCRAGLAVLDLSFVRPLRINWLTVGKLRSLLKNGTREFTGGSGQVKKAREDQRVSAAPAGRARPPPLSPRRL